MKDLVLAIARALVDHPDAVEVREIPGDGSSLWEMRVDAQDRGKVIGKEGRIIKAIRTVVAASAAKQQKRCTVELAE